MDKYNKRPMKQEQNEYRKYQRCKT